MSSGAMMSLTLETALETPQYDVSCDSRLDDLDTDLFRHRRFCHHPEAQQLREYQLMLPTEQQPGNDLEFGKRSLHQNDDDSIISHLLKYEYRPRRLGFRENRRSTRYHTPQSTEIHNKILRFCYLACVDFENGHDGKMMVLCRLRSDL
jgi:hypothetical protein